MRADGDPVLAGQRDGGAHHSGIASMKSAGDIRGRNVWKQDGVLAQHPGSKRLPYVSIEVDLLERHG